MSHTNRKILRRKQTVALGMLAAARTPQARKYWAEQLNVVSKLRQVCK